MYFLQDLMKLRSNQRRIQKFFEGVFSNFLYGTILRGGGWIFDFFLQKPLQIYEFSSESGDK